MRAVLLALVGLLLVLPGLGQATTITAASCSQADVASALATAVDGDTVHLPACSSTTWTSGVSVTGKALVIEGAGVDVTTIALSGTITGFTLSGTSAGGHVATLGNLTITGAGDPNGHVRVSSTYRFRLHHLKITATANRDILITGSYGLIDHLTVLKSNGSNAIQVLGASNSPSGRWTQAMDFATPDQVFIEDSLIQSTACNTGLGAIDGFNGSRMHFRHNTVRNQQTYNHGYDTASESALWTLFTNNTFDMAAIPCPIDRMVFIRGGTGLFHNNTMNLNEAFNQYAPRFMVLAYFRSSLSQQGSICGDNSANSLAVDLYTGSPTGYPCFEQTGFGAPWPTASPWYEFNNVGTGNMGANLQFVSESAHVVLNRDYVNDTAKPGFTEYPYPHPYQSVVVALSPPTNLRILP